MRDTVTQQLNAFLERNIVDSNNAKPDVEYLFRILNAAVGKLGQRLGDVQLPIAGDNKQCLRWNGGQSCQLRGGRGNGTACPADAAVGHMECLKGRVRGALEEIGRLAPRPPQPNAPLVRLHDTVVNRMIATFSVLAAHAKQWLRIWHPESPVLHYSRAAFINRPMQYSPPVSLNPRPPPHSVSSNPSVSSNQPHQPPAAAFLPARTPAPSMAMGPAVEDDPMMDDDDDDPPPPYSEDAPPPYVERVRYDIFPVEELVQSTAHRMNADALCESKSILPVYHKRISSTHKNRNGGRNPWPHRNRVQR